MTKEVQIFTVRTANGGFVGTFRAMTAQQAIKRAVNGLAETAQTFRRSQPMPSVQGFTASVEAAPQW